MTRLLLLALACACAPVPTAPPADECIAGQGWLLHDVHEGERVRLAHPPGSGQTYSADGARAEVVGPIQSYVTIALVDVASPTVLFIVRAHEGGDVLCWEVERVP